MRQQRLGPATLVLIFALSLAFGGANAASRSAAPAAPLDLMVSPEPKTSQHKLTKDALYKVTISCSKRRNIEIKPYVRQKSLWVWTEYSAAHTIAVSTKLPLQKLGVSDRPPSEIIALTLVFSIDANTGEIRDNIQACEQSYLVRGSDRLFLVPMVNLEEKNQPGTLLRVLNGTLGVMKPLAPLFLTATPLPDVAKPITDSVQDLLSAMNQKQNYTESRILNSGTTVVTTKYSTVTIDVQKIESIVTDGEFINELKKPVPNWPDKVIKPGECIARETDLRSAGVRDVRDIAFALGYLAVHSFAEDNRQILHCLRKDLSYVVMNLSELWDTFAHESKYTKRDIDNLYPDRNGRDPDPLQRQYEEMQPEIDKFVTSLGQYTRNKVGSSARDNANKKLVDQLSTKVTLIDETGAGSLVDAGSQDFDNAGVAAHFEAKGYRVFGCYTKTDDNTGKDVAPVIFLAFEAAPGATDVSPTKAITIHPIFSANHIARLRISNDRDRIDAVLKNRKYCGDIQIKS